jgi:hypothetical protein
MIGTATTPARRRVILCAMASAWWVAVAPAAERINYTDPPQGVFVSEWLDIEMSGNRIGYMHTEYSRTGDEINVYSLMSISLKRVGSPAEIRILQTSRSRLDGTPLAFTAQSDLASQKMLVRGSIKDGEVRLSSEQFDVLSHSEFDFPPGALMTWGTVLAQEKHGYKPGTKYSFKMYEPTTSANAPIDVDVEIHERETITIDGEPVKAIRTTQLMMSIATTSWIDDSGMPCRVAINMAGLPMVMTRTSKENALKEFSPPEFFSPTTIQADRPIDRKAAQRVDYTLSLRDNSVDMPELPRTAMQKVGKTTRDTVQLTVARIDHAALRTVPPQKYGKEFEEFLAPNPIINSDDPAVREMAHALRVYVTDIIKDKNLDVGFATASEVCRNKQGDCSEHAVLLAALGRVHGLPSRVVTGVVYVPVFGGDANIFGFHMWTQFRIGDQWVDFDAAQRESDCNPTHIAFSATSLHDAGLGQIAFNLTSVIGNLDIKIEKIEPENSGAAP